MNVENLKEAYEEMNDAVGVAEVQFTLSKIFLNLNPEELSIAEKMSLLSLMKFLKQVQLE